MATKLALPQYWSRKDLKDAEKARKFRDLYRVALRVAHRQIDKTGVKGLTVICGPLTNGGAATKAQVKRNFARFEKSIRELERIGFQMFRQPPFERHIPRILKSGLGNVEGVLTEFYRPFFASGVVVLAAFRPDWRESYGARWENRELGRLSIYRVYLKK